MAMNLIHRRVCSSNRWAAGVAGTLPKQLSGVELGDDVLEVGPGFGATTRVLVDRVPALTVLEIDPASTDLLQAEFGDRAEIVLGSGAEMPFPDGSFSAVVCFSMLHHVPTAALQDAIFAEAARVLRPGGVFFGTDNLPSLLLRIGHIGDTMNMLDPAALPARLEQAGLERVVVQHRPKAVRFSGMKV